MKFDVVMECTAASPVIADGDLPLCAVGHRLPGRRLGGGQAQSEFDIGGFNRKLVLDNERRVREASTPTGAIMKTRRARLAKANHAWLGELISRRVPLVALAGGVRAAAGRHQGRD